MYTLKLLARLLCLAIYRTLRQMLSKVTTLTLMINYNNYLLSDILYTYKFLRDVNFTDDSNLGFSLFYFCVSLVITPCVSSVLRLLYEISKM